MGSTGARWSDIEQRPIVESVTLKVVPSKGVEHDIAQAHAIHQNAHVAPWKLSTFADCFTQPYYGVFAYHGEHIIGYAIVLEVVDEATLMDIAVDSNYRGAGVGYALVRNVLSLSEQHGMSEMWLEVRESNHNAIRLYEHTGFEHIETRKNYYTSSGQNGSEKENAKIMKWTNLAHEFCS
ncbi:hypothetical protein D210916BOD24_21920 [Alteromonas sp. D210916BOD_24]|uniref:ribosomal protein S18-alanine N-acetyltransferase n=1 Tax=Alteromonas sp. D210916BOD_24 TaxID=3157618 RepID=UPI00399C61C7